MKQLVTLASLCRDWPRLFERVVWPENETFLWNNGMFVQLKFCGCKINQILYWELCEKEVVSQHKLRQIHLYFCARITQKQW